MQSEFPDASNRTVPQNCFLHAVLHGIGLAILFLYIHISASTLAWAVFTQCLPLLPWRVWDEEEQEASHISPSVWSPPCLSQAHACPQREGSGHLHSRGKRLRCSRSPEDVTGNLPCLPLQSPSWGSPEGRSSFQQQGMS